MEADRLSLPYGRIWTALKLFRLAMTCLPPQLLDQFPICCMLAKSLTLCCASSILQSNDPQSLQRRTKSVAYQLALWSGTLQETRELSIWEDLDPERRTILIAILARLICKTVCPENLPETEERKDEH